MRKKIEIIIDGMSCTACSSSIEKVVGKMEGVEFVSVNLTTKLAKIVYDNDEIRLSNIFAKIEKLGFKPIDLKGNKELLKSVYDNSADINKKWLQFVVSAFFTVFLMYISMGAMIKLPTFPLIEKTSNPFNFGLVQLLLTIPVMLVGKEFYKKGWGNLFRLKPNMDTLIAVSTTTSFLYSVFNLLMIKSPGNNAFDYADQLYFETVAMIITLIFLGKTLEFKSKSQTTDAIKSLISLRPEKAEVIVGTKTVNMPVDCLELDDVVLVKAGEKIPVDGEVVEGNTNVDESLISGESLPCEKKLGDEVIAGSINVSGVIKVKMTKENDDTVVSKIIKLVEDAQLKKAPIAKIADAVSGYFVPVVITIAILSALIWFVKTGDFGFAIKMFVSVLVISCPCALGLATPTAIMVATGRAATEGVFIKSGEVLENAYKIKTIVLDKTGTITEGKPHVTVYYVYPEFEEKEIIDILYTVEENSNHPLADAVVRFCQEKMANKKDLGALEEIAGKGVKSMVDGKTVVIGNKTLMDEVEIDFAVNKQAIDFIQGSVATIYVSIGRKPAAIFTVEDVVRPSSIAAIKHLKDMKIKTVMLTGDNYKSASYIAKIAGIDKFESDLLPQDKTRIIKKYKRMDGVVGMVGDGINDAPALANADIGFAIGSGTDVAIKCADIVLMKNSLMDAVFAIEFSKATIWNIKENLFFAFIYNILAIPIAAGLFYKATNMILSPMIGAAAMSMSSVSVVSNALRLRKFKKINKLD